MTVLQIHAKADSKGVIHFDIPLNKPDVEADVQVLVSEVGSSVRTYDFSSLTGRLKWNGDAVRAQRDIRNEW